MNLRALGDHVIILRDPLPTESVGGVVLPPIGGKPAHKGLEYGTVIGVGPGSIDAAPTVKPRDRVLFIAKKAVPITNPEKQDLVVLREEDIVAVVD